MENDVQYMEHKVDIWRAFEIERKLRDTLDMVQINGISYQELEDLWRELGQEIQTHKEKYERDTGGLG